MNCLNPFPVLQPSPELITPAEPIGDLFYVDGEGNYYIDDSSNYYVDGE